MEHANHLYKMNISIQLNLSYPDLYYSGTPSVDWAAQSSHVVCSLLAIMKFELDKKHKEGA